MKLYIKNINPDDINIDFLKEIELQISNYREIYSEDGIFRIKGNNIYQLIIEDKEPIYLDYNKISLIIDKSKYIFREKCFSLPFDHIMINVEQKQYKLHSKSKVQLNIINYDKKCHDVYFEINADNLENYMLNEIDTFFSLLKNIK